MKALDKATLVAIATQHPVASVRRCAAHTLFSLGCLTSALATAEAMAKEKAQEVAAANVAQQAIAKASGGAP